MLTIALLVKGIRRVHITQQQPGLLERARQATGSAAMHAKNDNGRINGRNWRVWAGHQISQRVNHGLNLSAGYGAL
jgi:hypothetical protein